MAGVGDRKREREEKEKKKPKKEKNQKKNKKGMRERGGAQLSCSRPYPSCWGMELWRWLVHSGVRGSIHVFVHVTRCF
jgi:hypothetical protein